MVLAAQAFGHVFCGQQIAQLDSELGGYDLCQKGASRYLTYKGHVPVGKLSLYPPGLSTWPSGPINRRILHANNFFMLPNWIQVWREVRGGEKAYRFEGEAAAVRFFKGLACLERFGVPNGENRVRACGFAV